MRAMQNPGIFPFYTYGTNVKLRTFKILYFQKYVFSNSCTFQKIRTFKFMHFSKLRTFKITYFQKYVLFAEFRVFKKIPRKNSPFQSSSRIPQKNSVFFKKFPVQKKFIFTNSVFFQKKFRVLQNSPVFRFLNL